MDVTFRPVRSREVPELAELAHEIWFEYWPPRIGQDQTAYMVELFQSEDAITRAMAEDAYEYWFIVERGTDGAERIVGYTGHVEPETNRFFISKIYVLASERGRGLGKKVVRFYDELCRERGLRAMYLTVNKGNELAIHAYDVTGFRVIEKAVTRIGGGFVMDDYIMEREVSA